MCRLLFQPRTPGVHGKDVASETYNFQTGCQRLSRVLFSPSVLEKSTLLEGKEEIEDQL